MSELDIGTLTGKIELEDLMSSALVIVGANLDKFAEHFDGVMGSVTLGAAAIVGAVGGIATSIVLLGEKGSTVQGVTEAFDHLAESAGTSGDALRGALTTGVKGTVDQMTLMQDTVRLLSSGMKVSSDQMQLMGQAALALGRATGTDTAQGLQTLSQALLTGRTRTLQQQIGLIDLTKAEYDYARSLGYLNAGELSKQQKLFIDQQTILQATKNWVDRLGDSTLTFKQRVQQAQAGIEDWMDELAVSIATSPHVQEAMDAIGNAINKAFGGTGKTAIETITNLVNDIADWVTQNGPGIIQFFKDAFDWLWKWKGVLFDIGVIIGAASLASWAEGVVTALTAAVTTAGSLQGILEGITVFLEANPFVAAATAAAAAFLIMKHEYDAQIKSQEDIIALQKDQAIIQDAITSKTALTAAQMEKVKEAYADMQRRAPAIPGSKPAVDLGPGMGLQITQPGAGGAAPKATELTKEQQTILDKLQGRDLADQIRNISAAVASVGGMAGFTRGQLATLGTQLDGFVKSGADIGKTLTPIFLNYLNSVAAMKPVWEDVNKVQQASMDAQIADLQQLTQQEGASLDTRLALNDQFYDAKDAKIQQSNDFAVAMIQAQLAADVSALNLSTEAGQAKAARLAQLAALQIKALDIKEASDTYVNDVARMNEALKLQQAELQRTYDNEVKLNSVRAQGFDDDMKLAQAQAQQYNASYEQIAAAQDNYFAAKRQKEQLDYNQSQLAIVEDAAKQVQALQVTGDEWTQQHDKIVATTQAMLDAGAKSYAITQITTNLDQANDAAKRLHDRFGDSVADLQRISQTAGQTYMAMVAANALSAASNRGLVYSVDQINAAYANWAKTVQALYDAQHPQMLQLSQDLGQIGSAISQIGQSAGSATLSNIGQLVTGIGGIATAWMHAIAMRDEYAKNAKSGQGPTGPPGGITGMGVSGMLSGIGQAASSTSVGSGLMSVGMTAASTTASIAIMQGALTASAVAWGAATMGIGAAVVGIVAWINHAKHAAEVQKALNQQLSDTHDAVQQEFGTTGGTLAQAYENASKQAVKFGLAISDATGDASHHSSEDIKRVQDQLAALDKVLQEVAADASKMGLTFADMDPSDAADAANKAATALEHTFTIMTQAGYKSDAVIKGMAPDLNSWLSQALQAGVKIPAAMQPIIEQLIRTHQLTEDNARALEGLGPDATPSLQDITDAASRYGLTLDQLGGKVPQLQINDQAAQIEKDFKTLSAAGVDFGTIMTDTTDQATGSVTGMHHAIQDMVDAALKSGDTIPAGMQPIIQSLIDQGQLMDTNGDKLTDIGKINFETPIADKIDDLIDKLGEFVDTMTGSKDDSATSATSTMAGATTTATQSMTTDWGKATSGINAYTTAVNTAANTVKNFPSFPNPSPPPAPNPSPSNPNNNSQTQSTPVVLTLDGTVVARSTINTLNREGV